MTKKDKIYLFIILILPIIFFFEMYFSNKIIYWLDMPYYFMPMKELCAESIKQNVLPLWNPYIYCGNPLLANMQSAVFYPISIFYYIFPFDISLKIGTYLTFFIMSIFFYFFLRLNNFSEEASFFSSLIFSYNYYMLIKAVELADINVLMWLPAILYFAKKFTISEKKYDFIILLFVIALSFLGGHLQVFSYIFLLLIIYLFYEYLIIKKINLFKFFKIIFCLSIPFILIVSIQLFPTIKFIILSKRNLAGINYNESLSTYLHFEQILLFFFPFLKDFYPQEVNFFNWVNLINVTLPGLVIFFTGCLTVDNKKIKNYWLIVFVFVLFICTLGYMPFYSFLYENLKIFQLIRYVSKINIILLFIICFFIAIGYDNIFSKFTNLKTYNSIKIFILIFYILLILFFLLLGLKSSIIKIYKFTFDPYMSFEKILEIIYLYDEFLEKFLIYLIIFFVVILINYLAIRKYKDNLFLKNFIILFSLFYLFYYFNDANLTFVNYKNTKLKTAIISEILNEIDLKNKRILSPWVLKLFNQVKVELKNEEDFIYYQNEHLYPNIPISFRIKNVDGFDSLYLSNFYRFKLLMTIEKKPWEKNLFKLFSAKYIISKKYLEGKNIRLIKKGFSLLYEYDDYIDISFFIPANKEFIFVDETEIDKFYYNFLSNGEEIDPTNILVFSNKYRKYLQNKKYNLTSDSYKIIYFKQENLNEYKINIKNDSDGFLVLTDNYYPGWEVYVNGIKQPIYEYFFTFKSVFLEKGINNVKFVMKDKSLNLGFIFSLLFFIILLIYNFVIYKRNDK